MTRFYRKSISIPLEFFRVRLPATTILIFDGDEGLAVRIPTKANDFCCERVALGGSTRENDDRIAFFEVHG